MANNNQEPSQVIVQNVINNINNAGSGCGCSGCFTMILFLVVLGTAIEWIEENPTLSIIIGIVIVALIASGIYFFLQKRKK